MYSSPVELIYKDAQYRIEEGIYKAIQDVDIKVNRDELIKALEYDRHQYEKGYADALAERKKGRWVDNNFCSECRTGKPLLRVIRDNEVIYQYGGEMNFCPTCGAEMKQKVQ